MKQSQQAATLLDAASEIIGAWFSDTRSIALSAPRSRARRRSRSMRLTPWDATTYPLVTPERWMKDFNEAGFKDKFKPLILNENLCA